MKTRRTEVLQGGGSGEAVRQAARPGVTSPLGLKDRLDFPFWCRLMFHPTPPLHSLASTTIIGE